MNIQKEFNKVIDNIHNFLNVNEIEDKLLYLKSIESYVEFQTKVIKKLEVGK